MGNFATILLLSLYSLLTGVQDVNLVFVGDAMQHSPQVTAARRADGSFDYKSCFRYVADDIAAADFAVANLECPLGGTPYTGYPCFSAPDEYAKQLKDVGFDMLATANNHCLDRGDNGLLRTLAKLNDFGILHVGTYENEMARKEQMPCVVDVNGVKIAFMSYTYGTNGIKVRGNVVVNYIDEEKIKEEVAIAREAGAQVVCAIMHWGEEYQLLPNKWQKHLADVLIDEGVDLIIGSHPHVIQPMEIRYSEKWQKRVLVVYSLGNFISNQSDIDTRGGAMVSVQLSVGLSGVRLAEANYRLFFCQKPSRRGENYVLIPSSRSDLVRADSRPAFAEFMRRANNIFNKHNINVPQAKD